MKSALNNLITSAVLLAGIAVMSRTLAAADASDPVSKLLADAKAQSSQLSLDWKSCAKQSAINWAGDAADVARIKDDLAAAAKTIASLNASRNQASPSQSMTIDRMLPVLQEVAANTGSAIKFLGANQARLNGKEYREYLDSNSDTSTRLAGIVAQLVEYGNGRDKFENAKRALLASK